MYKIVKLIITLILISAALGLSVPVTAASDQEQTIPGKAQLRVAADESSSHLLIRDEKAQDQDWPPGVTQEPTEQPIDLLIDPPPPPPPPKKGPKKLTSSRRLKRKKNSGKPSKK